MKFFINVDSHQEKQRFRTMYLIGGLDRYIDRYIGRYIGRYLAEYRLILDRLQVDISVEYRWSVDRCIADTPLGRYTWRFTDTLPIIDRYLTYISPMLHRYFTSVDTPPTRDRQVNALVSVDISTERLVDTSVDSIQYRSTVSSMGRYVGRQYRSIYRQIVSSIGRCIGRYIKQYIDRYFGRQTDVVLFFILQQT